MADEWQPLPKIETIDAYKTVEMSNEDVQENQLRMVLKGSPGLKGCGASYIKYKIRYPEDGAAASALIGNRSIHSSKPDFRKDVIFPSGYEVEECEHKAKTMLATFPVTDEQLEDELRKCEQQYLYPVDAVSGRRVLEP